MGWTTKELWSGSQQQKYIFLFFKVSRLSLESTLPPTHWVVVEIMPDSPAAVGVKLIILLCLVPRLRISGATPPLLCMSSWHVYKTYPPLICTGYNVKLHSHCWKVPTHRFPLITYNTFSKLVYKWDVKHTEMKTGKKVPEVKCYATGHHCSLNTPLYLLCLKILTDSIWRILLQAETYNSCSYQTDIYNNKVHGLPTMKIDTSKIITKYVYIHSASTLRQSLKPDENLEVMYTALECSPTSRDCTLLQSTGYSMLHNNFTVKSLKTVY